MATITLNPAEETIRLEFGESGPGPDDTGPITFVSSDTAVAEVRAAWDHFENQITPIGTGTVTLTLRLVTAQSGAELQVDGAPFVQPDAVELEVDVTAARGERVKLVEASKTATPAPPAGKSASTGANPASGADSGSSGAANGPSGGPNGPSTAPEQPPTTPTTAA